MARSEDLRELREQFDLTDSQWQAVDTMATQPGVTQQEIAEAAGVTRQTLYKWRKSPPFEAAVRATARTYVPTGAHAAIIDALVKGAQAGDPKLLKLYLTWRTEIDSGGGVEVNVDASRSAGPPLILFNGIGDENWIAIKAIEAIISFATEKDAKLERVLEAAKVTLATLKRDVEFDHRYVGGRKPVRTLPESPELEESPGPRELPEYQYDPPDVIDAELVPEREPRTYRVNGETYTQRPGESDRAFTGRVRMATKGAV